MAPGLGLPGALSCDCKSAGTIAVGASQTVDWYEEGGLHGPQKREAMSDHRPRLARQIAATLGIVAVAIGIVPATASAVMTSTDANVVLWYSATGIPVINGLAKASTDFSKGQYVTGCTMFETVASKALTEPLPPDATIAFHWGVALGFYIAGGDDCVQGLQADEQVVCNGRGEVRQRRRRPDGHR